MDNDLTVERDTAETVIALKNFDAAMSNYDAGLQWLSSYASLNTDFLSRKIEAGTDSWTGQDERLFNSAAE